MCGRLHVVLFIVDVIVTRRNQVTVVCAFINHSVLTSVLKAVVLFALPLNSILFSIMCVCVCVFFFYLGCITV